MPDPKLSIDMKTKKSGGIRASLFLLPYKICSISDNSNHKLLFVPKRPDNHFFCRRGLHYSFVDVGNRRQHFSSMVPARIHGSCQIFVYSPVFFLAFQVGKFSFSGRILGKGRGNIFPTFSRRNFFKDFPTGKGIVFFGRVMRVTRFMG